MRKTLWTGIFAIFVIWGCGEGSAAESFRDVGDIDSDIDDASESENDAGSVSDAESEGDDEDATTEYDAGPVQCEREELCLDECGRVAFHEDCRTSMLDPWFIFCGECPECPELAQELEEAIAQVKACEAGDTCVVEQAITAFHACPDAYNENADYLAFRDIHSAHLVSCVERDVDTSNCAELESPECRDGLCTGTPQ